MGQSFDSGFDCVLVGFVFGECEDIFPELPYFKFQEHDFSFMNLVELFEVELLRKKENFLIEQLNSLMVLRYFAGMLCFQEQNLFRL